MSLHSITAKSEFAPLRLPEHPFTAEESGAVTILFGGLTWKHERLIEGLLNGAGYRAQSLPETDRNAHELGKEFCASGLCNPVYFTVGNLVRFLQEKEKDGLSREEIVRRYVYFTAACGGPCRFGMYESEFRAAMNAAGYTGFRILSFSQDHGIYASTGHSGLKFNVDFGLNTMHAFILGDLLNLEQRRIKPFEAQEGATDRAIARMADGLAEHFSVYKGFELSRVMPKLLCPPPESRAYRMRNTAGKLWTHLYGRALTTALPAASEELRRVEVDWLRVRPRVKVIGEFWAQMTESEGNFRMMDFLEREGAEVSIEPISAWLLYLLHQKKAQAEYRGRMLRHTAPWSKPWKALRVRARLQLKRLGFFAGAAIYRHHYERLARLLAVPAQPMASQRELAALAEPFYDTRLRGGEGHLEVAKTLHYTRHQLCHLIVALKPFGCLPSIQSDAVQAALVERFPEVRFLPIETSADGEVHAYSRVQMALSEAKARTTAEFERVLGAARHSLDEIRAFVAETPELRHPMCAIPRVPGVISTAANFVLYADRLMSARPGEKTQSYSYNRKYGVEAEEFR